MSLGAARRLLSSPWLRVVGTLGAVALLVRGVDLGGAGRGLRDADPRWAALGFGLTGVAVAGSVVVWGALLRSTGHLLPWRRLSRWYVEGLFVSQVVPAGVGGDALRAVEVGRVAGHGPALASLAGSRMTSTLGMAAWGVAGAVVLRGSLGTAGVVAACGFFVAMVVAWGLALLADNVVGRLRGHACPVRRRIHGFLNPFTATFRIWRRQWRLLLLCLAIGSLAWGINLSAMAVFGLAVGVNPGWSLFAVAIPVTLLATLAPFSLNGVGVREGVLVGLLAHAGIASGPAASLSILIDLQMVPFAIVGAGIWLRTRSRGRSPAPARTHQDAAPARPPAAATRPLVPTTRPLLPATTGMTVQAITGGA